ncbi:Sugar fermentation stimulation protein, partial [Clarias magur]
KAVPCGVKVDGSSKIKSSMDQRQSKITAVLSSSCSASSDTTWISQTVEMPRETEHNWTITQK